jgi:hypothetical protein
MLAARLVHAIEEHAEDLTRHLLEDLAVNPRTPSYHSLSRAELHDRVYEVYRHLGRWIDDAAGAEVDAVYEALGRQRRGDGVPLEEVVFALILTKVHLRDYVLRSGLVSSIVDLYQEVDLVLRLDQFFDRAVYDTVKGYQGYSQRQASVQTSR